MGSLFSSPSAPNLLYPDTMSSTPTLAQTNTTAIQTQLNKESQERFTTAEPNGGSGLLDAPQTTSSVLMGS